MRLWDFSAGGCVLVLSGHGQPTWGCSFHWSGQQLASCSADRTAKVWDLGGAGGGGAGGGRCRLTLRRHVASVNSVSFLAGEQQLLTASADRSLALWDGRLGQCTLALLGHRHPCNHAAFGPTGHAVASCDAGGAVHLWDLRGAPRPTSTLEAGPLPANQVAWAPAGRRLAVACGDSLVRLLEADSGRVRVLPGHRDDVHSVTFDHQGESLMSAGRDGIINIWTGASET